jgi:hypothetical protein
VIKFVLPRHVRATRSHSIGFSPCLSSWSNQLIGRQSVGRDIIEFLLEAFRLTETPIQARTYTGAQKPFWHRECNYPKVLRFGAGHERHTFFRRAREPVEVFAGKAYRLDCDCSLDLAHSLLEVGMTPARFPPGKAEEWRENAEPLTGKQAKSIKPAADSSRHCCRRCGCSIRPPDKNMSVATWVRYKAFLLREIRMRMISGLRVLPIHLRSSGESLPYGLE